MAEATPTPSSPGGSLLGLVLGTGPLHPPEEDRATPELDKVGELVARGTYAEASQQAAKLLREGSRDVRIISPWLFGTFLEKDLASIHTLFSALHELLTQRWASFGPRTKKEVLADNGLRWLFRAICKHLEHHESLQDDVYNGWRMPRTREPIQQALALSEPLLAALASTLPKGHSVPPFRQLISWMETFLKRHAEESAAAQPMSAATPTPEAAKADTKPAKADTANAVHSTSETEHPEGLSSPSQGLAGPSIPASPALALLMRKLQSFDTLIRDQDFTKASVVATDVLATVERFDPRIYLPALFTPFFAHLSAHAQSLEPLMQDTDSLSFRALQQLYQVNLDTFLLQSSPRADQPEE